MYLNAVVFASVLPAESSSSAALGTSNTFTFDPKKIKASAKNAAPSSVDAAAPTGFISQIDLSEAEAFGVKAAPFAFRDASIPLHCLSSLLPQNEFFFPERNGPCLLAYHPLQSAIFAYAGGKEKPVCRSFGHERVTALSASPCGRFVVAGMENGSLAAWCVETGELVAVVEGAHFQAVRVVRFTADGQLLATGAADALVKVWYFSVGCIGASAVYSFSGHSAGVTDLCFSACSIGRTGRLLSCSLDGSVRMIDLCDGQCLLELKMPGPVTCLALDAAETQLFCGTLDGSIHAIDLCPVPAATIERPLLKAHRGPVSALAWSPEDRVLISAGLEDGCVAFWDSQTSQLMKTLSLGQKCGVSGLVVLAKGEVAKSITAKETKVLVPFKRVGSAIGGMDQSVPLRKPSESKKGSADAADGDELGQLKRENTQLRQINGELVSLLE